MNIDLDVEEEKEWCLRRSPGVIYETVTANLVSALRLYQNEDRDGARRHLSVAKSGLDVADPLMYVDLRIRYNGLKNLVDGKDPF